MMSSYQGYVMMDFDTVGITILGRLKEEIEGASK